MAVAGLVISAVVFSVVLIVIVVGSVVIGAVVFIAVVMVVVVAVEVVVAVVASRCEFKIVDRTNPNMPRPRSMPRARKREHKPNLHLLGFRVDTWPSLDGLIG